MDPNANLREQLDLARGILQGEHVEEKAEELAELVLALDEWVSKGGFLPDRYRCRWKIAQKRG